MIFRCDIWRRGADTVDDETGGYTIPGEFAEHLTNVFCLYSYDVRRTTGERETVERQVSVRYMEVFVPLGTDVHSEDVITEVRDRRGNVVIRNAIDIIATQVEVARGQIRLVCQERR